MMADLAITQQTTKRKHSQSTYCLSTDKSLIHRKPLAKITHDKTNFESFINYPESDQDTSFSQQSIPQSEDGFSADEAILGRLELHQKDSLEMELEFLKSESPEFSSENEEMDFLIELPFKGLNTDSELIKSNSNDCKASEEHCGLSFVRESSINEGFNNKIGKINKIHKSCPEQLQKSLKNPVLTKTLTQGLKNNNNNSWKMLNSQNIKITKNIPKKSSKSHNNKRGRRKGIKIGSKRIKKSQDRRYSSSFKDALSGFSKPDPCLKKLKILINQLKGNRNSSRNSISAQPPKSIESTQRALSSLDSILKIQFKRSKELNKRAGKAWTKMNNDVQQLAVKAAERQLRLLKKVKEYEHTEKLKEMLNFE